MRVQSRQHIDSLLSRLGVERDIVHGTGCYTLVPTAPKIACLAIDGVLDDQKATVACTTVRSLAKTRASWWMIPKFTYFGKEPISNDEWFSFNLPTLTNEAVEWEAPDLPHIERFIARHFAAAWNIGWDLYLVPTDGTLLAFFDHHDCIEILGLRQKDIEALAAELATQGVESAFYP